MMVGMLLDMVIVLKFSKLASMSFTSIPTVYCIFFKFIVSGKSTDKDDEVSECGSRSDLSSEDEDHVINPGSCSGEVVSDTDSNGSRFDDGADRGESDGGESDDGTDGGGGDDGGCSINNDDKDRNLKKEIVSRILRGLILAEEMKTSIKNMESLLEYAKGLYCKGDSTLEKYWPSNWRETERLLKEEGYEDPKQYFICLDESHHANYDIMEDKNSRCRFCGKPGAIQYYYLGLPQKVKLWCSDESMCQRWPNYGKRKTTGYIMKGLGFLLKRYGMVPGLAKSLGFGTLIVSGCYPPDVISAHLF